MTVSRGCCGASFAGFQRGSILLVLGVGLFAGCGFKAGSPASAWVVDQLVSQSAEPGLSPAIRDALAQEARLSGASPIAVDVEVTRLEHHVVGAERGGVLRTELELRATREGGCSVRAWATRDVALPEQPELALQAREAQVAKLVEEGTAQLSDRLSVTEGCTHVR